MPGDSTAEAMAEASSSEDEIEVMGASRGAKRQSLMAPLQQEVDPELQAVYDGTMPEGKKLLDVLYSAPKPHNGAYLWYCKTCRCNIHGQQNRAVAHVTEKPKNSRMETGKGVKACGKLEHHQREAIRKLFQAQASDTEPKNDASQASAASQQGKSEFNHATWYLYIQRLSIKFAPVM
jgi:hypothetical protein